jgi:hypothetical protein
LVQHWQPRRIVGHADFFVRTRSDELLLVSGWGEGNVREVMCQTTLVHVDDCIEWRSNHVEDDEPEWYRRSRSVGNEIFSIGPTGFCFWNHSDPHLWAPPDSEWALRAPRVARLGAFDMAIVSGEKPIPDRELITPTFDDMRTMMSRTFPFGAIT